MIAHFVYRWLPLALLVVMTSCQTLYRMSLPSQHMHQAKGDNEVKVGLEFESIYASASHAFTDHFSAGASYQGWSNQNTTYQFGEIGLSMYAFKEGKGRSLSSSFGIGNSMALFEDRGVFDPIFGNVREASAQFARISLQPAWYQTKGTTEMAFAVRSSAVYWLATTEALRNANLPMDIYLEPYYTVRFGTPMVKFFLESSLVVPVFRSLEQGISVLHFGFGVNVLFHPNAPSKRSE
jgi:hypothetical protein